MKKIKAISIITLLLLNLSLLAVPQQKKEAKFEVTTKYILTEVTVLDEDGKPITGLKKENFRLMFGGKEQKILTFDEITKISAAGGSKKPGEGDFILDLQRKKAKLKRESDLYIMAFAKLPWRKRYLKRFEEGFIDFMKHSFREDDRVVFFIISPDKINQTSKFLSDRNAIVKHFSKIISERDNLPGRHSFTNPSIASTLFNSFTQFVKAFGNMKGRKKILLFSSGIEGNPRDAQAALRSLREEILKSNCAINVFQLDNRFKDAYGTWLFEALAETGKGIVSKTGRGSNRPDTVVIALKNAQNVKEKLDEWYESESSYYIIGWQADATIQQDEPIKIKADFERVEKLIYRKYIM